MDHNESVRKFEHLMLKQADHARAAASELAIRILRLGMNRTVLSLFRLLGLLRAYSPARAAGF